MKQADRAGLEHGWLVWQTETLTTVLFPRPRNNVESDVKVNDMQIHTVATGYHRFEKHFLDQVMGDTSLQYKVPETLLNRKWLRREVASACSQCKCFYYFSEISTLYCTYPMYTADFSTLHCTAVHCTLNCCVTVFYRQPRMRRRNMQINRWSAQGSALSEDRAKPRSANHGWSEIIRSLPRLTK